MIQSLVLTTIVFCVTDAVEATREYGRIHGPRIIEEFSVLLATPNVADDGPNIRRNAEYLARAFRARDADIVPFANHDNIQHAPDENLRIADLWYNMDLTAVILRLGDGGP